MLHKFFEEGYWFAPKKYGYGSGLPIAWQGWVLLAGYITLVGGLGLLSGSFGVTGAVICFAAILLITWPFMIIARRRTKGGWNWRG